MMDTQTLRWQLKNGLNEAKELASNADCANFINAVLGKADITGGVGGLLAALDDTVILLRGWNSTTLVGDPENPVTLGSLLGSEPDAAAAITYNGNVYLGRGFYLLLPGEKGQALLHEAFHLSGLSDYGVAAAAAAVRSETVSFESDRAASKWFQQQLVGSCN